jgi:hypothetical protein
VAGLTKPPKPGEPFTGSYLTDPEPPPLWPPHVAAAVARHEALTADALAARERDAAL